MPVLNNVDDFRKGTNPVSAIYYGATKVWPAEVVQAQIAIIGAATPHPPNKSNYTRYRSLDFQSLSPQVGDIALVLAGHDNNWGAVPGGYTLLFNRDTHVNFRVMARVVDGTEGDWQFASDASGDLSFDATGTSRGSVAGLLIRGASSDLSQIQIVDNFVGSNSSTYSFPALPAVNSSSILIAALCLDDERKNISGVLSAGAFGDIPHLSTHFQLQDTTVVWGQPHNGDAVPAFSDSPAGAAIDQYATLMVSVS